MKKILLFLLVILIVPALIYAQEDDWYYNSKNLIINIDVSSEAIIKPTSSNYSVKYINVNLSHYPYEYFGQEVIDLEINPEADVENNAVLFRWENPKNKINFGYNTKIKTNSNVIEIKNKIKFPILDLPEELKQYTEPNEIINSDDEDIIGFASEIAEGEDDLYVVVHKMAEWTKNNIEYDLSTLTAEISQKASWVIDNRQGVCDELTSLFIAMLRSLGIPGKFVSGIAYTESELFPENWGSHGWAEIYFPGYGWVPYDVTYGQFGYLDPTHVKLKESVDSNEPSVSYKWVARNIDLETEKLDIDTTLGEKIGRTQDTVNLDVRVLKQDIGFGSYNLIEVILENLEDYYISSEIYISKPIEVELTGNFIKNILLKPNEKKSVFWIVKLTDDLQKNFVYTFPITVSTIRGSEKDAEFKSKKGDIDYSFEEINSILEQRKEEEEKVYSKDVEISCQIDQKEFYSYETALVKCKIKNIGNTVLKNLNVCFESECSKTNLGIVQENNFNYTVEKPVAGIQESIFKVKNIDVSKAEYIEYTVLDKPEIKINEIEAPNEVEYIDQFKISFLLSKESNSIPENVEVTLFQNNFEKTWTVKEFPEDRKFVINLLGKNLKKNVNEFNIVVKYEDGNGKSYETQENFFINLTNVTLIQNVLLVFNQFVLFVDGLV
ncbi:MAG: transglutaminase-like domain-containing protein [Flavobacteriales bacterium]|jgi:transglutaminase-like putative cysteine protease|nr:transglutaminase-like domain-containing protein [Flavobacteriales bacterium]